MKRLQLGLVALFVPALAAGQSSSPPPPSLEFHPVVLGEGQVAFKTSRPKKVAELPFDRDQVTQLTTQAEPYELFTEFRQFNHNISGYYFWIYLQRQEPGSQVYGYKVDAYPIGSFKDSMRSMEFVVRRDDYEEKGYIILPVYAGTRSEYVQIVPEGKEIEVRAGSMSRHPIHISNLLTDLPVTVSLPRQIKPDRRPDLWEDFGLESVDGASVPPQLDLDSGSETEIRFKGRPTFFWPSLESAFPSKSSYSADQFVLAVSYNSKGGRLREALFPLPVVFLPSYWALGVFLVLGTGAGTLLLRPRPFLRVLPRALLLAAVLWLVALQADSRLMLFGFEIHPQQLMSTFILGLGVGGLGPKGPAVLRRILGIQEVEEGGDSADDPPARVDSATAESSGDASK